MSYDLETVKILKDKERLENARYKFIKGIIYINALNIFANIVQFCYNIISEKLTQGIISC